MTRFVDSYIIPQQMPMAFLGKEWEFCVALVDFRGESLSVGQRVWQNSWQVDFGAKFAAVRGFSSVCEISTCVT